MTFDTGNIMDFRSALSELRQATPGLPMREGAAELGISEAELLAAHCHESGEEGVRRLDGDWLPLLARLGALGSMLLLTRNEHAILQQKAPYSRLAVRGSTATAAGPGRGLVLQLERWAHGFAVVDQSSTGLRRSLQFFDGEGSAVHKVFLQEGSAHAAFEALASRHLHEDQSPILGPSPGKSWALRSFPGLRDSQRIWRVEPGSLGCLLLEAMGRNLQIQISVASGAALQTLCGPVGSLQRRGDWLQVLDPTFNLAIDLEGLASAWVTREEEGPYRLQLLNLRNEDVAELRGSTQAWNELLYALPVQEP